MSVKERLSDQVPNETLERMAELGELRPVGQAEFRDGSEMSEAQLREVFVGRTRLSGAPASGAGRSPRRQVRLPETTNTALDEYAAESGLSASAVIRLALEQFLEQRNHEAHAVTAGAAPRH